MTAGLRSRGSYIERLAQALPRVQRRVLAAAERSGRASGSVRVVAVTKGHSLAAAGAAVACGLSDLGENRPDELAAKAARLDDSSIRWHMIGHVQSRRARAVAMSASLVHSVDRLKLARRLSRIAEEADRHLEVLVQVNASGESTKGGFPVASAIDQIGEVADLGGIRLLGLMTMAPLTPDEGLLRQVFGATRELMESAATAGLLAGRELSMGMSNDYELAVEEGSTMVRLGTVLFGERPGAQRP